MDTHCVICGVRSDVSYVLISINISHPRINAEEAWFGSWQAQSFPKVSTPALGPTQTNGYR